METKKKRRAGWSLWQPYDDWLLIDWKSWGVHTSVEWYATFRGMQFQFGPICIQLGAYWHEGE